MTNEWAVEDNSNKKGGITNITYKPKSENSPIAHIKYLESEDYDRMHVNQRQIEISARDEDALNILKILQKPN